MSGQRRHERSFRGVYEIGGRSAALSPMAVYAVLPPNVASMPVLLIGSSYENGTTAIDADSVGALGGAAVGAGSYLSLGDAIIKDMLPGIGGLTINEAAVGSTTFDRFSCFELTCLPGGKMLGYLNQYNRALQGLHYVTH